jgi:hypothetical protein
LAILTTARFKQLTPHIEELLGEFRLAELELLESRQQTANRNAVLATFVAAGMTVLAPLSSAFGAYVLERQRVISQLRATNEELTKSQENLKRREAHLFNQANISFRKDDNAFLAVDDVAALSASSRCFCTAAPTSAAGQPGKSTRPC